MRVSLITGETNVQICTTLIRHKRISLMWNKQFSRHLSAARAQLSVLQRLPLSPSSSLSVPCDNNNSSTERSCTFQLIFLLSFLLLSLIIVPPLSPPKTLTQHAFFRQLFLLPNLSEELNSRGFFHLGVSRQAGFYTLNFGYSLPLL